MAAPTTTEVAEPSTIAVPAEPGVALDEWITAQEAAGRTQGYTLSDDATDAEVVVAYANGDPYDVDGGLLLASRRVIDLPEGISTTRIPAVSALAGRPVIVSPVDDQYVLWQLSADDVTWSEPVDLGVFADPQSLPWIALLGDLLVVANQTSHDIGNGFYEPDRFEGVVVNDSLEIAPMSPPPPKQFLWVTSTVRTHALMLGLDSAADANAPLTQPWDYDVTTDTWSAIPIPDWLECGTSCNWMTMHEMGDRSLEVVVDDLVVKLLPDGSIATYTPDTQTWSRLDDAPFALTGPSVAVLGDQLAVAPVYMDFGAEAPSGLEVNEPGTVGVLDLATGTWTSTTVDVGQIPEMGYQLCEARSDGTIGLFDVIYPEADPPAPSAPDLAYDSTTRQWRIPTADESARWSALGCRCTSGSDMLRDLLP
ncbi:MAG: hypothetical protein U0Q03_19735 [Acidimicrobiales bacterium]